MKRILPTAVYAAGHFLVDFACAFLMFRMVWGSGSWLPSVLLYNFFAFAVQMPLGLLADRTGSGRLFAAAGCLLTAASCVLGAWPTALSVTAGLGNALFHIGGGRDTLAVSGDRARLLGIFVSPGAFGLFLGAMLGRGSVCAALVPILLAAAAAAILLFCDRIPAERTDPAGPSAYAALMLGALFIVVCLRSYAGFLFSFPWKTGVWAWVFALCVVLGKTAGGFFYDRFGGTGTTLASLLLSAVLFLFSGSAVCGCFAVLLFNMTMPVTLRAAADRLPGAKGFSFGLLTMALFLGFLPEYLRLPGVRAGWMYAALCAVSLALLLPAFGRRRT